MEVNVEEDSLPAMGLSLLAQEGKAFDWLEHEPDVYTTEDLKVRYQ